MTDPQIDISDWPTFTNTKYGWSIKYHPEGVWRPDDPQSQPNNSPSPAYSFANDIGSLQIIVHENTEEKNIEQFIRSDVTVRKSINVNNQKIIACTTDHSIYFLIQSNFNLKIAEIELFIYHENRQEFVGGKNIERFLESVKTFKFIK